MNLPKPAPWERGYYGHVEPPQPPPEYNQNQFASTHGMICNQCVAVVQPDQTTAHTQWHEAQRRMSVSNVKWCDAGDHAFKAGRPGSQNVMGTEINEHGQEVSVQQDVCPECAATARQKRALAVEAVKPQECPECSQHHLVYSQHMGANVCLACGWASNQFADTPGTVSKLDVNQAHGKHAARYMSDDRPERA